MQSKIKVNQMGMHGAIRGVVDISGFNEWSNISLNLSRDPEGTFAQFEEASLIKFLIANDIKSRWNFLDVESVDLVVARAAITDLIENPSEEIEIENRFLYIFYPGRNGIKQPFKLRLKLGSSKPALPTIAPRSASNTIYLDRDATGRETEIFRFPFEPPDYPTVARPPTSVTVAVAAAQPANERTTTALLASLRLQLLKAGDHCLSLALDGRATFSLEYNDSIRRFDPEGIVFTLETDVLMRVGRVTGSIAPLTLIFEFLADNGTTFGSSNIELSFVGDFSDRLIVRWRGIGASEEVSVHLLDSIDAAPMPPPVRLDCERLLNGSFAPATLILLLRVEPTTADIEVSARLDDMDFTVTETRVARSGRGEWSFDVPVGRWLKAYDDDRTFQGAVPLDVAIAVLDREFGKRWTVRQRFSVTPKAPRPKWIACIDYGASTTAIWLGSAEADMPGVTLKLGQWLDTFDRGSKSGGADDDDDTLLPSYVGLSHHFHLRSRFDPLSLGDLNLALPGRAAAQGRLGTFNYVFDVSVPFPSRAQLRRRYEKGKQPSYLKAIIHDLKRAVVRRESPPRLPTLVLRRTVADHGVSAYDEAPDVDLAKLMMDVFAELGGYVALQALNRDSTSAPDVMLGRIAEARTKGEPFIVAVTHPYGVGGEVAETYRRAGERFARAFVPRLADETASHVVVLAPEALASAQAGLQRYRRSPPARDRDDTIQYVTFDIGAGTFDACLIEDKRGEPTWRLLQHFGVALGGADLDAALLDATIKLLGVAGRKPGFRTAFELVLGFDEPSSCERSLLAREIQSAKVRLNRTLQDESDAYEWRRADLSIRVGIPHDPEDLDAWPVRFRTGVQGRDIDIKGDHWSLAVEHSQSYGRELRLRIQPRYFESADIHDGPLGQITRVLGEELPKMALNLATATNKIVIVTGRAALWPPLYALIRASARGVGATMSSERPLSPRDMKVAVVEGAKSLATRPVQFAESERNVTNPLAMLVFGYASAGRASLARLRVIQHITLLPRIGDDPKLVDLHETFVIASIIPGLDRLDGLQDRFDLFEQIRETYNIKPYIILSSDIHLMADKKAGHYSVSASGSEDRIDFQFRPTQGYGDGFVVSVRRQGRFYG